jgi:hypothetical protein
MAHGCEDIELVVELRQWAVLHNGVWWESQKFFFKSNWLLKIPQFVSDYSALVHRFILVRVAMGSLGENKQVNTR